MSKRESERVVRVLVFSWEVECRAGYSVMGGGTYEARRVEGG